VRAADEELGEICRASSRKGERKWHLVYLSFGWVGWLVWCWRGAKLEGNKFKHDVKSTLGLSTFRAFTYLVLHLVSTSCIRSDVTSSQHRQTLLRTWSALVAWKACTLVIERNIYFPYIAYEIWLYFISISTTLRSRFGQLLQHGSYVYRSSKYFTRSGATYPLTRLSSHASQSACYPLEPL